MLANIYCLFVAIVALHLGAEGRHLQFQLNGYECFFEEVKEGTECSLEFAPITGADPQIDTFLEDPKGEMIYSVKRKDYDLHKFKANITGVYRFCFSNVYDFTIGNNLVYFDFVNGVDSYFSDLDGQHKALTQLETSTLSIHENLNVIQRYQNFHRVKEANGRLAADSLRERVMWWSVGQSVIIISVGIAQVFVLRRFFTVSKENL